jgi:hypothetical protein
MQMNMIDGQHAEIVAVLQNLDINGLTPLDALNLVAELKKKAYHSG